MHGNDNDGGDGPIVVRVPVQQPAGKTRSLKILVSDLLGDRKEILLEHNGEDYRLRITSNGKLILTK
jgi:hemin uptake protein HemP